jgi:carbon storage regulator CsrA
MFIRTFRPGKKENAMLVLTRKIDEQIKIGDDITITVIKLRNNQIRLGIEAPRDVRVLRAELEETKPAQPASPVESARSTTLLQSKSSRSQIRNEVVDGLISADEMIAKGMSTIAEGIPSDVERLPVIEGETARDPQPNAISKSTTKGEAPLQIFSGRVRAKRNDGAGMMRAPLSDYFSAT